MSFLKHETKRYFQETYWSVLEFQEFHKDCSTSYFVITDQLRQALLISFLPFIQGDIEAERFDQIWKLSITCTKSVTTVAEKDVHGFKVKKKKKVKQ